MEVLTKEQSSVLNKIANHIAYHDLEPNELPIVPFLRDFGYITVTMVDTTTRNNGVVTTTTAVSKMEITELGKMYLINEKLTLEQRSYLEDQINSLKEMAETSRLKYDLLKAQCDENTRDNRFTRIISVISLIISALAVMPALYELAQLVLKVLLK